jgi:hypothetical protein
MNHDPRLSNLSIARSTPQTQHKNYARHWKKLSE